MILTTLYREQIKLTPPDNHRLATVCGAYDRNLHCIEEHLNILIQRRGHAFTLSGEEKAVKMAEKVLRQLYVSAEHKQELTEQDVHWAIQSHLPQEQESAIEPERVSTSTLVIHTKLRQIKPRNEAQQLYLRRILENVINIAVGPAGTGKTYLAVATAVDALQKHKVQRLILVRPAVEAGEKLGFLPGDLSQKVDPYLRPLYDALYDMLGVPQVTKLIERGVIEIAPLAFMRGRTLNDAFIILDEAQNTTPAQMKMFLTRVGFNATAVITGDVTQVDLPKGEPSGLQHILEVLQGVPGLSFSFFSQKDVVRHPLVQQIIKAYEEYEAASQRK